MKKIAILGPSGAGKSWLARELKSLLDIKVYHLDRLLWLPGWIRKDQETRIDIQQDLAREDRWIIEGMYLRSSEPRLNKADTIIFLDPPPLLCLLHLISRHNRDHTRPRRDIPEGCTDKLGLEQLIALLIFPLKERRQIMHIIQIYNKDKSIIWLRSRNEAEDFLTQLKLMADYKVAYVA